MGPLKPVQIPQGPKSFTHGRSSTFLQNLKSLQSQQNDLHRMGTGKDSALYTPIVPGLKNSITLRNGFEKARLSMDIQRSASVKFPTMDLVSSNPLEEHQRPQTVQLDKRMLTNVFKPEDIEAELGIPLAKKKGYAIKIDKSAEPKHLILTQNEITALFNAKIKDLGLQYFENQYIRFIEYCQKYCVNRKLELIDNNLGTDSAKVIAKIIKRSHHTGSLTKVLLSKNSIGDDGAIHIGEAVAKLNTITVLDLSSNSIGPTGAATLIQDLKENESLIALDLSSSEGLTRNTIGASGVQPFREVLAVNQFLMILNLAGNLIGDQGVRYICEGLINGKNKTLCSLNLCHNDISSEGVEKIYGALKVAGILRLNLSKNPLKNKGAKIIGDILIKGSNIFLDELNIAECEITFPGAQFIYTAIRKANSIKVLILDGNKLNAETMVNLSNAILWNNTLEKLSMQGCSLHDNGCTYIMDGLERNHALIELNLSNNNIRMKSGKRIAEVLATKDLKLQRIILANNFLGDYGGHMIARALAFNRYLTKVDLFDNNLRDESAKQILFVLAQNKTLCEVNLGRNGCNLKYVKQVDVLAKNNEKIAMQTQIPKFKRQIISLSMHHGSNEVFEQINHIEAQKVELEQKFILMDKKCDLLKADSAVKIKQYQEDLAIGQSKMKEVDDELDILDQMIKRREYERNRMENEWETRITKLEKDNGMIEEIVRIEKGRLGVANFKHSEIVRKQTKILNRYIKRYQHHELQYNVTVSVASSIKSFFLSSKMKKGLFSAFGALGGSGATPGVPTAHTQSTLSITSNLGFGLAELQKRVSSPPGQTSPLLQKSVEIEPSPIMNMLGLQQLVKLEEPELYDPYKDLHQDDPSYFATDDEDDDPKNRRRNRFGKKGKKTVRKVK